MEKLKIYGIYDHEDKITKNVFIGYDENNACQFILNELKNIANDLKANNLENLSLFIDSVRKCSIITIGTLNIESNHLEDNFNVLVNLNEFMLYDDESKEVVQNA